MKTLDKVINLMEYEAKYNSGEMREYDADLLRYLQEYRSDKAQYEADRKHWEDDLSQKLREFDEAKDKLIAKYKELEIGTLNPALTWDEIFQMAECPVWIKADHSFIRYEGWALIGKVDDDGVHFVTGCYEDCYKPTEFFLLKDFIGKTWNAYKKKETK